MNSEESQDHLNEITSCEVCGNTDLFSALNLGEHPLCDDLVAVQDERRCKEYPIEILYCKKCSTAHQRFQVPKRELFPTSYHYRSRFTADVLNGMEALVDTCDQHLENSLDDKLVLDVGCNDGSLLDFFRAKGARTIGVEPTGAYHDGLGKGHHLLNDYFSPESAKKILEAHGSPDIITFTNVFAHIEDLQELISALKILMSEHTMIVIENHYLGAVLDRHQFDTFYHEHPRTYSTTSFKHIANSLGVKLSRVEFPSRYGGNIRVFLGGPIGVKESQLSKVQTILSDEQKFGERLLGMQKTVEFWKTSMKQRIGELVSTHGRLSAKAFPGRAAILVKLLGLNADMVDVVYEKPGSMKIGHYLPGTRIPIVSDDDLDLSENQPRIILNLAWHISSEIRGYLVSRGFKGEIVDILDNDLINR